MITVKLKNLTLNFKFGFFLIVALISLFKLRLLMLYLLFSLLHELGHLIAMSVLGIIGTTITFHISGIAISGESIDLLNDTQRIFIYSSGCVVNLLLAVIFGVLGLSVSVIINFVIILYNLLPIKGFDGGNIRRLILNLYPKN